MSNWENSEVMRRKKWGGCEGIPNIGVNCHLTGYLLIVIHEIAQAVFIIEIKCKE